ncbi:MAG: peptidase M14, partial [Planctomycetota bacterium]
LAVDVDTEHFVGFGLPPTVHVVSNDRDIYAPIKLDRGRNVGVFAARETLLQSGFAWDEKLDQLARKPFVVHQPHGDGHVVAFAEAPNFRGFSEGTDLLWINAVLLGPAF